MTTKPAINALAPWFGGKRTMADRIVEVIGKHASYWEPFCGSMAVLLAKSPSRTEAVNDLNGSLINLARVVASDDAPKLYDRLTGTFFCEPLFAEVRARHREIQNSGDADPVEWAYCYFVESWMGMNGIAGTRNSNTSFCRRYTSNGGDPATRFRNAVDSIPPWHARLRGVSIYQGDGIEICERIEDKAGTVIYADPPYLEKGAAYLHDFVGDDHQRLATALTRLRKTRVIVSYYAHPLLESLYPGWRTIPVKASKALVSSGKRDASGVVDAPEVLLVNEATNDDAPWFGGLTL